MASINKVFCMLLLILFFQGLSFGETLIIGVENLDWYPHYYWEGNTLDGLDIEILVAVFNRMEIDFEFKALPWSRLLKELESKNIDAGVDLTYSDKRSEFAYYPKEHLSTEAIAFYVRKGSKIKFDGNLSTFYIKNIALMRGYDWGFVTSKMEHVQVMRFDDYSKIFYSIIIGRIEVYGGYVQATEPMLKKLGYSGKLEMLKPVIQENKHYIAFSKKAGLDEVARIFSNELVEFKKTDEYIKILDKNR